jgi:hypothetical protein
MVNGKNEKVADFFRTLVSMRTYANSIDETTIHSPRV